MVIIDLLLPEFDRETGTTRRLLERVPATAFAFKPHDKSMTLGRLASHVADLPTWVVNVMERDSFDLTGRSDSQTRQAASTNALVAIFDENVTAARVLLVDAIDGALTVPWTLKKGNQDLFTLPKIAMLRYFVLNHLVHHRGQLSVYLRLQDVPLPAIYGPSADEGSF